MSTNNVPKLVIPFALAVTLAIGFSLIVSTSTQATPGLVNGIAGENFRVLRWGNHQISEDAKILDALVDKMAGSKIDEQLPSLNSTPDLSEDEDPPLVAVKTVSTEVAHLGEVIAYTITLTNTSDAVIENVSLTDHLADGLTELSSLESDCGEASFSQRTVSWSGTVLANMPCVISFHVEIAKGAEGDIPNFATGSYPGGEFKSNLVIVKVIPYIKYLPVIVN